MRSDAFAIDTRSSSVLLVSSLSELCTRLRRCGTRVSCRLRRDFLNVLYSENPALRAYGLYFRAL